MTWLDDPSVLRGSPGPTPEAIERNLAELWREIEDIHVEATQVRMLNLLVYLAAPPPAPLEQAIAKVSVQYPGRTIILRDDPGPPSVEATIVCRVDGSGDGARKACGEQITLHGSVAGHPLHSLALSLLLAGLPVTVWCHGPLGLHAHLVEQFRNVADHLVVDSRTWDRPLGAMPPLLDAIASGAPHLCYSDLRWTALTAWRRLIAQPFDIPATRAALATIEELTIAYGGPEPLDLDALLLAGWLSSRLGWRMAGQPTAAGAEHTVPLARRDSRGSPLRLVLRHHEAGAGLASVTMRGEGGSTSIGWERTHEQNVVRTSVRVHDQAIASTAARLHQPDPARLFDEELARGVDDPVYVAALTATVELITGLTQ